MEEVSFRSGAVVAGGVLTAAGVSITLAVVLGGHSDAVASAPVSRPAVPAAVPATVAGTYRPPSAARAAATLHAAATPTPGRTFTSHRLVWRAPLPAGPPGWRGWHRWPPWPWPWGLHRHHRRR